MRKLFLAEENGYNSDNFMDIADYFYMITIYCSKLQKGGILVSRILDVSGRNSGHFQIVAANLSIFGIKVLQHCWIFTLINFKWRKFMRKQAFVQFYASIYGKIKQIQDSDIFSLKIRIPDKKSLSATLLSMDYTILE